MSRRRGERRASHEVQRAGRGRAAPLLTLAMVTLTLLSAPALAARVAGARDEGGHEEEGSRIELRRADRPSDEELRRVERWHERWRRQVVPIDRLLGGLGRTGQEPPVGRRSWCRALAEALLELDRESVLPVPSYAAGRSLRRGLDLLGQGAVACLEGRVYAASDLVDRAQRAFGDAAVVLRPYGVAP